MNTEIVHVGEAFAAILAGFLVVALMDVANVSAQRSRVLEDVTALLEKRDDIHILFFLSLLFQVCSLQKTILAPQ